MKFITTMVASAVRRRPAWWLGAIMVPLAAGAFSSRPTVRVPTPSTRRSIHPDTEAPFVQITPSGAIHTSAVNVLISYCDDSSLNASSRSITRDGSSWALGYTTSTKRGCGVYATSSGSFTLAPNASTTIVAAISDNMGNRGSATVTITYVPTYTVTVTADSSAVTRQSDATTSQTFTVRNSGSETGTYTLTPTCTGGVSSCGAPPSIQVASGQSAPVTVSYHTAIGPATGSVSLRAVATQDASANSTGTSTVTVSALPSNVMVNVMLPGWTGLERSSCLSIAIVRDVAYQCDAFRIAHPLPAVTTRARARVPALLYYSDWVQGMGASVNVSIPTSIPTIPDSVQFNVYKRNSDSTRTLLGTRSYGWAVDGFGRSPERLSISWVTALTGVLFYRLEVRFKSGSGAWQTNAQADGEMLGTYRVSSSFGAGWWLAGVEQLALNQAGSGSRPDSVVAWVDGDGSLRKYVYRQTLSGQDVYTADYSPDRPDTLIKSPGAPTLPWSRHAANNVRVVFDNYGRHSLTINRVGDTTRLAWKSGGALRLDTLIVPGGLRYVFQYDANDLLATVVSPAASGSRQVQFARQYVSGAPTGGVRKITDPSQDSVTFEYPTWAPSTAIVARTDRRLVRTIFDWEPWGPGLSDAVTPDGNGNNVPHYFHNPANVGMAPTSKPISVDSLFLRYVNPRGYATIFWLNSLGAPTQITNAVGQTTTITYGDSRFPGLATQVVGPGGLTSQATYNARGLADNTIALNPFGDGRNATTTYSWDPKWNMVTGIHSPAGSADSIAYDTSGNRLWQQDGRGSLSRVNFGYDAQNRLITVQPPGNPSNKLQQIAYDATLGNVSSVTTPMGFVSHYYTDAIGRDTLTDTPIDTLQSLRQKSRTTYNVADEVDSTISIGPAVTYTLQSVGQAQWSSPVHAETLYVKHQYDAEGNLTAVTSVPAPQDTLGDLLMQDTYTYDNLGRKTAHVVAHGPWENTSYDLNGNVISSWRPSGTLTMQYDALDRLTQRVMPARQYGQQHCEGFPNGPETSDSTNLHGCFEVYPGFPNDSTGIGYLMMADTSRFTYDATTGFMLTADNRYAKVHRSYYPNGAIQRDSLFVLNGPTYVAGNSVTVGTSYQGATYGWTKQYSLDGKDSVLTIPGIPSGGGNITYTYRTDDGALSTVTDPSGNWFRYAYDSAGRVDSLLVGPSGGGKSIWETRVYDVDGRQTRRIRVTGSGPLFDESFWFDAQGRPIKVGRSTVANGLPSDTSRFVYSGLGAVQARERIDQLSNWESEEYRVDALGNNVESRDGGTNSHGVHDPRYWQYTFHGELTSRNTSQPQRQTETLLQQFDPDGNVSQRFLLIAELSGGYDVDDQVRNYYDAANRLRATQHYLDPSIGVAHGTFDEYEYDALGRRIVVISRRNDSMPACHPSIQLCIQNICNQQATCNSSFTRYAWDGNQTLVEDRLPFGSASYGSDDGYVTYVHGTEIDRPLGVIDTRISGNLRVPHPTWRGMYESSSTASGAPADCSLTTNTCSLVAWNATNSLYKLDAPGDTHVTYTYTWVGGLLINQQDASGLLYRRNRYYDPMSGRFSQEDPIGLGGGLNTYGFAGGDPVNYQDPLGLCPPCGETEGAGAAGAAGVAGALTVLASSTANGVAAAIDEAIERIKKKLEIKYVTYTRIGPNGQVYSGRTSGLGDPQSIVNARARTHDPRLAEFGPPVVDQWATGLDGRSAIRGREQQLIDYHGGAQADQGSSANLIRGVRKDNPAGLLYWQLSNEQFGPLYKYTGTP